MISENELLALMADLESDRIERTVSTNDTTKFREAICAFSNDFPSHRQPGFLLIGVHDKTGKACGLTATDELLRNPVMAEALKILGYVNRFGRGVLDAQAALQENGSPEARFEFQPTFVSVTIPKHPAV